MLRLIAPPVPPRSARRLSVRGGDDCPRNAARLAGRQLAGLWSKTWCTVHEAGHQMRGGGGSSPLGSLSDRSYPDLDVNVRRNLTRLCSTILPNEAAWLADFESELLAFPRGRYDDQVDALLLLLDWFTLNAHYLEPAVLLHRSLCPSQTRTVNFLGRCLR
jgi:hypothetical protein